MKLSLTLSLLLLFAGGVYGEVTEVFYDNGQLKEKGNLDFLLLKQQQHILVQHLLVFLLFQMYKLLL